MSEINAIRFAEPWQVSCVKIPMPEPKPGEALIKIMAAGICGSDIGAFRGTNGLVSYPRVIGHELAGVVVSIPENNKNGIKVGDRVVVDPYLYCGHCYPCSIGRTNCCDDLHVLGVHVEGGMAEYFCHPADMLVKIPDGMSWVQAAMAEPLTISLHGIHRGGLKAGEYCAIIGAGPIGLAAAMVAQAYGAHAILLDLVQERLDFAKSLGVEYTINSGKEDANARVHEITGGEGAQQDAGSREPRRPHHLHRLAQEGDQPAHRHHHPQGDRPARCPHQRRRVPRGSGADRHQEGGYAQAAHQDRQAGGGA